MAKTFLTDIDLDNNKLINVGSPDVGTDGVNMNYVNIDSLTKTIQVLGGKNGNTTNSYLKGLDSIYMNQSPFILPFNATLLYISAATDGNFTWSAEVHVNEVLVTGAFLNISATNSGYSSYNINFNAGDKVQLYCNGTLIDHPTIEAVFKIR